MNSIKVLSVALYDCCACGAREASHTRFTKQPEHQTGQGWGWEGYLHIGAERILSMQIGQFIGTRADFVPEPICKKLSLLQDKVPY